ncbi:GTPase SAR1 family protein [Pedobacter sp. AK017]|uniref:AAA domain-containing protein n=1 Tax=Pedobacter sp. AK017 TaxID=2723073 RepID=UPI00161D3815|nr:AAA domain-containing protein [Pedobacter sp. AK017]MBB5438493.1 GTPase SAR1 family protein [Pedobacter sp. AK017]
MDILKWIKYWRDSLADAESINVDVSKIDAKYKTEAYNFEQATLPDQLFKELWPKNELEALKEGQVLDKEILISPLSLVPRLNHAIPKANEEEISPFWIPALLSSENELKPRQDMYPLIPRKILDPVSYRDIVFSNVDQVDEALAKVELSTDTWKVYHQSLNKIFNYITGTDIQDFKAQEFFEVKYQWVFIPDELVKGASHHILELYRGLIKQSSFPRLLKTIIKEARPVLNQQYTKDEVFNRSAGHLGQMNNGFGLSPSQRKSLAHNFDLKHGEILAVNGPPGTGKTTLIQSVIADNFVKSAMTGQNPLITVASSTNNQAITNIIDSFSKGNSGTLLEQRWLPDITSFALYMVSGDPEKIKKSKERNWMYHSSKKGDSVLTEIENEVYLQTARASFLEKLSTFSGIDFTDITTSQKYLQKQIKKSSELIAEGLKVWKQFKSVYHLLVDYDAAAYEGKDFSGVNDQFFEREISDVSKLITKLVEARQKEPFYFWLLSFLKPVKTQRKLYYESIFADCSFDTSTWDFSSFSTLQPILIGKSEKIKKAFSHYKSFFKWLNSTEGLKNEYFYIDDYTEDDRFLDKLDTKIRYQNFLFAVHYWESRWIEETSSALQDDSNWKNTEAGTMNRLHRFAMLTPCFVSTFHMLPKMMQYTRYPSRQIDYLYDFIDLLIVDEAGQVSPEVGAPSFSLAKKALVVGDNYQIEPVWNIDGRTDEGNLLRNQLITKGDNNRIEQLMASGYMSSNGSLMKLAQKSCSFAYSKKDRGLLLTEHRRCLNQIIAFCNELVYNNQLEPLSSLRYEKSDFLPPMGFLKIAGQSDKSGTSRFNRAEAQGIIKWLKANENKIVEFIYSKELKESKSPEKVKRKALHDLIGIVTPFSAQKRFLTEAMHLNGLQPSLFQYGTVHSLQGAEKDIVIFSPVYTSDVKSGYFFDMGPNMLNVAVSRAKRSFIVAGDKDIFRLGNKNVPSSLLTKYIKDEIK